MYLLSIDILHQTIYHKAIVAFSQIIHFVLLIQVTDGITAALDNCSTHCSDFIRVQNTSVVKVGQSFIRNSEDFS